MMDKIKLGIEFEIRFRENLWHTLKKISDIRPGQSSYGEFEGSCYLLPESGRQAAKDGFKVGDIILNGYRGFSVFIDCTSTYARSENRLKSRLKTSSKDLAALYEYLKLLNTYPAETRHEYPKRCRYIPGEDPEEYMNKISRMAKKVDIYPDVPASVLIQYDNLRAVLVKYLNNTFEVDSEIWNNALHGGKNPPYRFYGAVAFEYGNNIFVTLLSDATITALNKGDPSVSEILPLSFSLAGFALFIYDYCSNYSAIGKLDYSFNDLMRFLDEENCDEDD